MPTPDLPVELWLEILRYLPRSTLRRLIGLNRTFFELALDDMYEEVRFISDDKEMVKTFLQLKHASISKRVRHLFIRPAFLPGMDEGPERLRPTSKLVEIKDNMKNWIRHGFSDADKLDGQGGIDSNHAILGLAETSIKSCSYLHEITLVLHDQALTPLFLMFLNSLWASDSIGSCLRKLSIDTTVVKLPVLLYPLINRGASLPNLEALDVNISISRLQHTANEWREAAEVLKAFLRAFRNSLTSFTFSSLVDSNVDDLFSTLPHLPKLNTFEFLSIFNNARFPRAKHFTQFILQHASTLTKLVIKPRARSVTMSTSDITYSFWLNNVQSHLNTLQGQHSFANIVLPNLQTLDVGLLDYWGAQHEDSPLLPDITCVSPNLTTLIITDLSLSSIRVTHLLNQLQSRDGGSSLESITFSCCTLTPEIFDHLARALPRLTCLTINYLACGLSMYHENGYNTANNVGKLFNQALPR